ncbi:uncharacterized protein MELLADRAFT_110629 [Melampsora larici-populina 98AG31]|uniref:Uncharacterized protein n=1 Tax=Melampsora larici-populina (strain 98AG31 / pathotype 3-4-7) TaxID=747676 RepID=F4S0F5_MELLP|nr:uncharacterized protein MELLADRAFT_110629 [Melampsora larici-populina 98AG31]EGG01755.1 hypothetical protein MELLADRAFT_110629 [Melampsora larici-populina 98AG31]
MTRNIEFINETHVPTYLSPQLSKGHQPAGRLAYGQVAMLPNPSDLASLHDKLRVEESDLDAVLTIGTFADKLRELIFQTLGLHATSPAPALHQVRFYQQEPVQEPPVQSHRSSSPLTELSEHSERSSSPSTEICEVEERLPEQPPSPFHAFHEPTSKANRLVHSSLKRPAEIDETVQHKGKQRRTEFVPAAYVPSKPAQDFTPAQMVIQRKMAFEYVQKSIRDGHVVSLDYDLAVARFLQETSHLNLGDIPHAVDLVLAGSERQGLSTSLQSDAYQCAKYIKKTLLAYESDPQQGKPFALRYPNLHALRARAMTNIASMRAMPSDIPVILLDIAGRVLAIGLPPKRHDTPATKDSLVHPAENEVPIVAYIQNEASQPPNGNHQRVRDRQGWHITHNYTHTAKNSAVKPTMDRAVRSFQKSYDVPAANHVYSYPQERALLACLGLARVYNLPIVDQELFDQAPKNRPTSLTPFPLTLKSGSQLSQSSSEVSAHIGSIYGSVQYQLIGYGLGAGSRRYPQINSANIADKKLAFGPARQGSLTANAAWQQCAVGRENLPQALQMGNGPLYKARENARVTIELGWQYDVALAVILGVQPEAYRIANQNIDLLSREGDVLVRQRLADTRHRILCAMEPNEAGSSYLMHLDLISKTIEAWLHYIPMTAGLAECLEAVTALADNEMESFKKLTSKSIHLERVSKQDDLKTNTAKHKSNILHTPSMSSFKSLATLDIYMTPLDKVDDALSVSGALRHLVNTQQDTSPTLNMPQTNKRARTPDKNIRINRSPRRSARLSCSAKKVTTQRLDPFASDGPSTSGCVKRQKTQSSDSQEVHHPTHRLPTASPSPSQSARIVPPTPEVHSSNVRSQEIENTLNLLRTRSSPPCPSVADKSNSLWNQKIDLHLSESVKKRTILVTEVSAIHKASLVLFNTLTKGSCTQFDPDELLSHPVTFSSTGEPRIHEKLFTTNKGTIWYQPQIFNFLTISTSSPPVGILIHERYLWETIKFFHKPSPHFLERSMHYVLAALVLIGTDANRILPATQIPHQAAMSSGTRNAVTCWHHFKELSSLQSNKIVDEKSATPGGCIEDLDRLIMLIYTMIETFTSIWASTTLDEEISRLTNLIASAESPKSAEALTTLKDELTATRSQIVISPNNLPALASFLCCGVKGLMIFPKDKHTFGPLRAINFLLVTADLTKQGQTVEEPIWKRTQAYIVDFMKGVIQSSREWVPCEVNRYHLAKALFLDFSDFFLARDIRKIPIPTTRNYKVLDKECS